MHDPSKTYSDLIEENARLQERVRKLESLEAERRQDTAEKALRKSEERLAEAQRMAHLGFWYWDVLTGAVEWSDEVYRIFRLDPKTFTPHIDSILAFSPWPEDHARDREIIDRAIRDHSPGSYEQRFLRPDRSIGYYHSTFQSNYDENGNLTSIFGTVLDITELRQAEDALRASERKYRTLTEQMPDFVWQKDLSGVYVFANSNYARAMGLTPETMAGHRDADFYPPDLVERYLADDHLVIASGRAIETEEMWEDETGSRQAFQVSKAPLLDEEGRCIGTIGIGRNITGQKKADAERRELSERLQRAEKMEALGVLAGGVAHDLNNVLGILVGYSELLLEDIAAESPLRGHVEQIMNGGIRAAAIVQDLLTLARRGIPSEAVIDVNGVVADFLSTPEFVNLKSHHKHIRVRTNLAPDLSNIKGSATHLVKTFVNLLTNAAEAMPGGGVITVSSENCALAKPVHGYDTVRAGDYVVLSVSDTGEGIPEKDIGHIFEPFYTRKVMGRSGTGLGLAVVWGTVKDHNGYIDVRSEVGAGTTFTLYFPVTAEEAGKAQKGKAEAEYMGKGETVLVVDDVEGQRELAAGMLGRLGYAVHTAASGEEAVEYARTRKIDLIVLDMIMEPGMDGLDTYRAILEIHPGQKAVIVSGFSESERVYAAQGLGAGAYVRKPYSLETLGKAVRGELDRKRKA